MSYLNSITLVEFVGSDPEQRRAKGNGELVRDQASNAPTTLTVHCHTQTITLPMQPGVSLGDNGADRLDSISAACKRAESTASPNAKSSKPRTRSQ